MQKSKSEITGSEVIVEELVRQGVEVVFGYPGGAVIPLYDALFANRDRLHHVLTAHEQGAVHAADGYARAKNKTGVVIATSGPGATNIVTGIANAFLDSIPLVAITGNVPLPLIGKDSFQEVDIVGLCQPVAKHSFMVRNIEELPTVIRMAFHIANDGRKGPVLVDVPKDIQTQYYDYEMSVVKSDIDEVETSSLSELADDLLAVHKFEFLAEKKPTPSIEETDIAKAVEVINNSKKPFIYAGGGIINAGVESELLQLSQRINAPIGLSMMGLSSVDSAYELNLGMTGMHGKYPANMAQSNCDVIIALGVRFSDRATGNVAKYINEKHVIHIDIDMAEIGKNVQVDTAICADLRDVMHYLLKNTKEVEHKEWVNEIEVFKQRDKQYASDEFKPKNIIEAVGNKFEADTVVATDVGQHQMWTTQYYDFRKTRTLMTSGGLGTMGYGMGAAMGACIANDRKPTILFTGDGSFGMNLNEMATIVKEGLPVLIVLFNNGVLGMVRQWQTIFCDGRHSQTTTHRKTDFVALAKAFGADGVSVDSMDDLEKVLNSYDKTQPMLIECIIDKNEMVYPMIPPGGSVNDIILE